MPIPKDVEDKFKENKKYEKLFYAIVNSIKAKHNKGKNNWDEQRIYAQAREIFLSMIANPKKLNLLGKDLGWVFLSNLNNKKIYNYGESSIVFGKEGKMRISVIDTRPIENYIYGDDKKVTLFTTREELQKLGKRLAGTPIYPTGHNWGYSIGSFTDNFQITQSEDGEFELFQYAEVRDIDSLPPFVADVMNSKFIENNEDNIIANGSLGFDAEQIMISDNTMGLIDIYPHHYAFVDYPYVKSSGVIWKNFGMTKEEYEKQQKTDEEKNEGDVLEKNENIESSPVAESPVEPVETEDAEKSEIEDTTKTTDESTIAAEPEVADIPKEENVEDKTDYKEKYESLLSEFEAIKSEKEKISNEYNNSIKNSIMKETLDIAKNKFNDDQFQKIETEITNFGIDELTNYKKLLVDFLPEKNEKRLEFGKGVGVFEEESSKPKRLIMPWE